MLLTVKNNQRRLYQQIVSQFRGHRHFPVVICDVEASHGRRVRWTLRARNAIEAIRERWVGASWIIELVSTGRRDGKPFHHVHYYGLRPTASTSPPGAPAQKYCCAWCGNAGRSISWRRGTRGRRARTGTGSCRPAARWSEGSRHAVNKPRRTCPSSCRPAVGHESAVYQTATSSPPIRSTLPCEAIRSDSVPMLPDDATLIGAPEPGHPERGLRASSPQSVG